MCDYFLQRMEGELQAGDLADIVRAGGAAAPAGDATLPSTADAEWRQLQAEAPVLLFPPPQSSSDGSGPSGGDGAFGVDPFAGLQLQDPFGGDYPSSSSGAGGFFDTVQGAMDAGMVKAGGFVDAAGGGAGASGGAMLDMRRPILPRGMQMPAVSPRAIRPFPVTGGGDMLKLIGVPMAGQAIHGPCAFDADAGTLQMSSPHGGGGMIKRRKNQARKVVCIPAPAVAGARTSGEVVPSDLWAWRKYGQKPIKGSPHPRGYYRCSSSKGCSARKQVERSRNDPNMLVITYTSEHNHPWPTQRNALAGSTRNHHAKNSSTSSSSPSASKNSSLHNLRKPIVKPEPKDHTATAAAATTSGAGDGTPDPPAWGVKEEAMAGSEKLDMEEDANLVTGDHGDLMQQMFSQSYRPMIPDSGHHDDFFADLAELESDPMSLIFSKDYMATKSGGDQDDPDKERAAVAKADCLDPAYLLDWSTTVVTSAAAAGSSFGQGEGGL